MQLAFPCGCGSLLVVYDRRRIGNGYQIRARCVCGESTKVVYTMEDNFVLLRPRRNGTLDTAATDAKIESKEIPNGKK